MRAGKGIGNPAIPITPGEHKMSQSEFERVVLISLVSGSVSLLFSLVGSMIREVQKDD